MFKDPPTRSSILQVWPGEKLELIIGKLLAFTVCVLLFKMLYWVNRTCYFRPKNMMKKRAREWWVYWQKISLVSVLPIRKWEDHFQFSFKFNLRLWIYTYFLCPTCFRKCYLSRSVSLYLPISKKFLCFYWDIFRNKCLSKKENLSWFCFGCLCFPFFRLQKKKK